MIFSSVNFITLALLPPLIAPLLIYIFKSKQNIRDSIGVIGSLISFYATINITTKLMNGSTPELFLFNIFSNLSLSFKVTPIGAVFGLLAAFGYLFPNTELYLMFIPVPIKAKYFVMGYAAIELFSGISNMPNDNVAHFAHLGGALVGIIMVIIWQRQKNQFY